MTMQTDLDWKLCEAKQDCGPEHGKGRYGPPAPGWCSLCSGTGKVFVLPDSVRVPHTAEDHPDIMVSWEWTPDECHAIWCRGYTPSTDLAVWFLAAILNTGKIFVLSNDGPGFRVDVRDNGPTHGVIITTGWSDGGFSEGEGKIQSKGYYQTEPTPIEALQQALAQVLEAQGVTL